MDFAHSPWEVVALAFAHACQYARTDFHVGEHGFAQVQLMRKLDSMWLSMVSEKACCLTCHA